MLDLRNRYLRSSEVPVHVVEYVETETAERLARIIATYDREGVGNAPHVLPLRAELAAALTATGHVDVIEGVTDV